MDKLAAKKAMLKSLKDEMKSMMGDDRDDLSNLMKGKKAMKVTVASDSEKGLKEGLSKAEEIMSKKMGQDEPKEESEESCSECEGKGCPMCEEMEEELESSDEEPSEEESPEALKLQIAELKKQLASKE